MRRLLWALAFVVTISAQEVEDLGVLTPRNGIQLDKATTRGDVKTFIVEFLPQTPPTNAVSRVYTNEHSLVKISDLPELPSGPVVMGVKTIGADGVESEIALYRFDLRRGNPPKPRAYATALLEADAEPVSTNTTAGVVARRREKLAASPPPPIPGAISAPTPVPELEGASNKTYGDVLDAMAEHYAKRGRRNE